MDSLVFRVADRDFFGRSQFPVQNLDLGPGPETGILYVCRSYVARKTRYVTCT
jgi:hypothetical protein